MPEHGSRWWSKLTEVGETHPAVADVVHDKRYKHRLRYHLLNDTRQYGHRDHTPTSTLLKYWDDHWQTSPRIPLEWINTGSVWRYIPETGWWDRDRNLRVSLDDLVVVDRIRNGGVILARVELDGTLEHYSNSISCLGRITCHEFMWKFARVWWAAGGHTPSSPEEGLFPDVLYQLGYLKRHKVHVPTADETVRAIETVSKAEAEIMIAKRVIADRKKGLTPKDPRKRRPKKAPLKRLSAWERIMEDDG